MEARRNWSGLPHEMLVEIATRIPSVVDFMAFRGVCSSWRFSASRDKFGQSCSVIPLLMLPERGGGSDNREFYCPSERRIVLRLPLPELRGKMCMEARFGWLLAVDNSGEVNLLNPFTRAQIQLPNFKTCPEFGLRQWYTKVLFMNRAILSANPSHTSNFILVVIFGGNMYLGFWRPNNLRWTRIESPDFVIWDITYYLGKFYAVNRTFQVWAWDGLDNSVSGIPFGNEPQLCFQQPYLARTSSTHELLVLWRDIAHPPAENKGRVTNFGVMRLDVMKREWEKINSLRDDAIFVGHSASISFPAAASACSRDMIEPNCIYFADDSMKAYYVGTRQGLGGMGDIGIYRVEDASIERFTGIESFPLTCPCPPIWITPSL